MRSGGPCLKHSEGILSGPGDLWDSNFDIDLVISFIVREVVPCSEFWDLVVLLLLMAC